ncbi:hypothetical protein MKW98_029592 [Papaver atlanticum]|uniref:Yippee domain-containing protein n=1 Tax=Papaver atlanticum TaxID=357466 RepID=A0AAD4X7B4_9MAGN|nr:hypothetical protein MKW98_029592 [Papaver atlanticum]
MFSRYLLAIISFLLPFFGCFIIVTSCKFATDGVTNTIVSNYDGKEAFDCRHGKAYLFNKLANFTVGETEERMTMTGVHSVCDIFCVGCGSIVGWKYVAAQVF